MSQRGTKNLSKTRLEMMSSCFCLLKQPQNARNIVIFQTWNNGALILPLKAVHIIKNICITSKYNNGFYSRFSCMVCTCKNKLSSASLAWFFLPSLSLWFFPLVPGHPLRAPLVLFQCLWLVNQDNDVTFFTNITVFRAFLGRLTNQKHDDIISSLVLDKFLVPLWDICWKSHWTLVQYITS